MRGETGDETELPVTLVAVSDDDDSNWWSATGSTAAELLRPITTSLVFSSKQQHQQHLDTHTNNKHALHQVTDSDPSHINTSVIISVYLHSNICGWLWKDASFLQQSAYQLFRVIQGHSFGHQSKGHMRLPISH